MRQVQREDGRPPEDDAPERFVRLRHRGDGTVCVQAVLHPDEAQRVMDALRVIRTAMSEAQNPPSELRDAQPDLADALTRIADDILLAGAPPAHGAAPSRGNADTRLDHSPGRNPHAPSRGNAEARLDTDTDAPSRGNAKARLDPGAPSRGNAKAGLDTDTDPDAPSRGNAERRLRGAPDIDADIDAVEANENAVENPADAHTADQSAPGVPTGEPADHTSPSSDRSAADRSASTRGAARTSGADRTQIIVHLTEDRIDGGHTAFLDDGTRIAPETFRRLACDCALVGVREDHRGAPLDVGRKTRAIPPALRRAVLLRDEHCQFPGCTHDRHIDLHHIEHWAHGGPTSKQNLIALCTFHHTLVHEGGFTLEPSVDRPRFLAPDRARLPSFHVPPPAPADPLQAFERAHQDLHIHDETGLTRWDGERVHYGDVVEVLCAADAPDDLDLPVRAWLAKHGVDH